MNATEQTKLLADTMKIIEDFFWYTFADSGKTIELPGIKGWHLISPETAKKLKMQVLKYKLRK